MSQSKATQHTQGSPLFQRKTRYVDFQKKSSLTNLNGSPANRVQVIVAAALLPQWPVDGQLRSWNDGWTFIAYSEGGHKVWSQLCHIFDFSLWAYWSMVNLVGVYDTGGKEGGERKTVS